MGGKCVRLEDLLYEEKVKLLREFESYALIIEGYSPDKRDFCSRHGEGLGGYEYVKKVFGVAPVIAGINARDEEVRRAELQILKEMGLEMYVASHVGGTPRDDPFQVSYGLLERPSDFGFPFASKLENSGYDGRRMAELFFSSAPAGYGRPLLGALLVHDYDFYRRNWLKTPLLGEGNSHITVRELLLLPELPQPL